MSKPTLTAIGIMCGTSKDGIDMMLGKTDGIAPLQSLATISLSFPPIFPQALRAVEYALKATSGNMEIAEKDFNRYLIEYISMNKGLSATELVISEIKTYLNLPQTEEITFNHLTKKYTNLCIDLINQLLVKAKFDYRQVDVIGDHGIALYHNPDQRITIQIADGQRLANETGIFIVNNFRYNDVKNGGQGAPLAPVYHKAVMASKSKGDWVVANLGGTANITLQKNGKLIGFDTGPANILLDNFIRDSTKGRLSYDIDGKNALAGILCEELLESLKKSAIDYNGEDYLKKLPPKSLDVSNYRLIHEIKNYSFEDVCATLAAFTADSVIEGIKLAAVPVKNIIICGGGARNPAIMNYLNYFAKKRIEGAVKILQGKEVGIDSEYLEAELFAFLAVKTIYKEPISFTTTTGCKQDTLGGHGYLPYSNNVSEKLKGLLKQNPRLMSGYLKS